MLSPACTCYSPSSDLFLYPVFALFPGAGYAWDIEPSSLWNIYWKVVTLSCGSLNARLVN